MIEIFELKGRTDTEKLDFMIVDIYRKYRGLMSIKKINVLDKEKMKEHDDVVEIIKRKGIDALPIIKIDGKFSSLSGLEKLLK